MNIHAAASFLAGALVLMSDWASAAIDDVKANELLKQGNCMACHQMDKKIIGPSFKEVAFKRKFVGDALADIMRNIREGSNTGAYGSFPMPPTSKDKINDADLKALVEWVLSK